MSFAVRVDGLGWRAVNDAAECTFGEAWQEAQPLPIQPSHEDGVRQQISELLASKGLVQKWQVESAAASVLALAIAQGLTESEAYVQRPGYKEAKDLMVQIAALEAQL